MNEELILDGQTEQESTVEEVPNYEEQTEQDSVGSLDDILAGPWGGWGARPPGLLHSSGGVELG